MKDILTLTICILFISSGNAQSNTWMNDSIWTKHYSKFLKTIDTTKIGYDDFEVRLWFNNGANKINTTSFLCLTFRNKIWDAKYFTFISFPIRNDSIYPTQRDITKLNFDSLYEQLLTDSLLTLRSDSINTLLDKKGLHSYQWFDSGPTNYTIEIITFNKRWALNYKCPKTFYIEYKIQEFKMPLKIITALLQIIGTNGPC